MKAFEQKKILDCDASQIPLIAEEIRQRFAADGYKVKLNDISGSACDISISDSNIFKAVCGLRTALKVTLAPRGDKVYFEAGVGLFGLQVIPTVITMFVFWPVLVTQIWGLVKQAKLDDKALAIAEEVIAASAKTTTETNAVCIHCGSKYTSGTKFCTQCGQPIDN